MGSPENPTDKNFEKLPPTDEQLLALLKHSNTNRVYKGELNSLFSQDPWIKRQLTRIYLEIDRAFDTPEQKTHAIDLLWDALSDDWKRRRKLPLDQRK